MRPPSHELPSRGTLERLLVLAGALVVVTLLVVATAKMLLILFAGVLLAVWLRACSEFVARLTGLPVGLVLAVLVTVGIGALGLAFVVAPRWGEQLESLQRQLPIAIEHVREYLRKAPLVGSNVKGAAAPLEVGTKTVTGTFAAAAGASIEIVGALIVMFFIAIYAAAQPQAYVRAILAVTARRHHSLVERVLKQIKTDLTRWLLGRAVAMTLVGVIASLAFYWLQLPLPGLLGLLAGLLTFVEYLGAFVSGIPPLLLGFAQSPATAAWVLLVFTGLHVFEGYLVTPFIVRTTVRFPPAITLASQALFGVLLGPLGLTFSTPLLVVAAAAVKAWRAEPS